MSREAAGDSEREILRTEDRDRGIGDADIVRHDPDYGAPRNQPGSETGISSTRLDAPRESNWAGSRRTLLPMLDGHCHTTALPHHGRPWPAAPPSEQVGGFHAIRGDYGHD
jgi:hypothetical protein